MSYKNLSLTEQLLVDRVTQNKYMRKDIVCFKEDAFSSVMFDVLLFQQQAENMCSSTITLDVTSTAHRSKMAETKRTRKLLNDKNGLVKFKKLKCMS